MGKVVQLVIADQTQEIQVKDYRGQRVVTFRDVDEVHGRPEGTARVTFNRHKDRFKENEDYFVCQSYEAEKVLGTVAPNGLILLTESGYLMLTKPFNDEKAWEVQRQLVNHYFRSKALAAPKDSALRQVEIEARLRNAKTRQARLMKEMAEGFRDQLSPESIQLLLAGVTELLMGKALLPKPQIDIHFTATEVAEELGVSANKVGRIANKLNLKTSEYGKWVLDKAAHSDKQVRSFLYNEKGRAAIVGALNRELKVLPGGKAETETG